MLKYLLIAGGVVVGVVVLKRVIAPTSPKLPTNSPGASLIKGISDLAGAFKATSSSGDTQFLPDDSNPTVVIGPDSASLRAVSPSPVGFLGPSPFSVSVQSDSSRSAPPANTPQPASFTSIDQRATAGVGPSSLFRLSPVVARY